MTTNKVVMGLISPAGRVAVSPLLPGEQSGEHGQEFSTATVSLGNGAQLRAMDPNRTMPPDASS